MEAISVENYNYVFNASSLLHISPEFNKYPNRKLGSQPIFTYQTPLGYVPVIDINTEQLLEFINNMKCGIDCHLRFISDPLCDNTYCDEIWICKGNKFYFTEYEDGHSAFDHCWIDITHDFIYKLDKIYNIVTLKPIEYYDDYSKDTEIKKEEKWQIKNLNTNINIGPFGKGLIELIKYNEADYYLIGNNGRCSFSYY